MTSSRNTKYNTLMLKLRRIVAIGPDRTTDLSLLHHQLCLICTVRLLMYFKVHGEMKIYRIDIFFSSW